MHAIRRCLGARHALSQPIVLALQLSHLLMACKAVEAAVGAEFAARVVVSGSMEPAFKRGDVLLFRKTDGGSPIPIHAGDILLFKSPYSGALALPIVHRVIEVHERRDGISALSAI